jgi:hypothetical protein
MSLFVDFPMHPCILYDFLLLLLLLAITRIADFALKNPTLPFFFRTRVHTISLLLPLRAGYPHSFVMFKQIKDQWELKLWANDLLASTHLTLTNYSQAASVLETALAIARE